MNHDFNAGTVTMSHDEYFKLLSRNTRLESDNKRMARRSRGLHRAAQFWYAEYEIAKAYKTVFTDLSTVEK